MRPAHSAIIFLLPLVSALSNLQVSTGATSGGPVTITWSQDSTDPSTCSFELVNTVFHNSFAIANNIQTSLKTLTVTLPAVPPGDQYTLEAVQIDNINAVIGTSGAFSIGATVTTSAASTSSPASSSLVSATSPANSSASATPSTLSSGATTASSASSSSTSSSSFNGNGALGSHIGSGNVGSIAAAVIGIVAGAVLV